MHYLIYKMLHNKKMKKKKKIILLLIKLINK